MRNMTKGSFLLSCIAVLSLINFKAEAALLVAGRGGGVLRYDEQTGAFIDTFIPVGSGGLVGASSWAFGPDQNLYVSDYFRSSVLKYNGQTGAFIDTFIPSDKNGIGIPESIAFGQDNNLYVSGFFGTGLRRYNGQTGAFIDTVVGSVPNSGNQLNSPNFAFGSKGDIYLTAVFPTAGILRYNNATRTTDTFIGASSSPEIPGGLTFGSDNNLYVTDFVNDASIRRYDGKTGAFIDAFVTPGSGGLTQASRVIFGRDNNLYVSSFGSDSVLRYNGKTGAFIDAFVPSGSGGLNEPIGLVFTPKSVPETSSILGVFGLAALTCVSSLSKSKQRKHTIN